MIQSEDTEVDRSPQGIRSILMSTDPEASAAALRAVTESLEGKQCSKNKFINQSTTEVYGWSPRVGASRGGRDHESRYRFVLFSLKKSSIGFSINS